MPDNQHDGGTEGRLRKLLSSLPRVEAPGDFEGRVRRKIASHSSADSRSRRRITALAIPALSLIVIGGLALLVYQTRFERGEENPLPPAPVPNESPQVTEPGTPPSQKGETAPAPVTPLPGKAGPPESRLRRSAGEKSTTRPPDAKKADGIPPFRGKAAPGIMKSEREVAPALPAPDSPGRPGMPLPAVPADSLTPKDSVGEDSGAAAAGPIPVRADPSLVPLDTTDPQTVPPHR
jgi:type IV secretory pathway VirB10-like protein